MDNVDLGPMKYRCPKCDAKLLKGEIESGDCWYCKTNTKQSDWEQGNYTKDAQGNWSKQDGTPIDTSLGRQRLSKQNETPTEQGCSIN